MLKTYTKLNPNLGVYMLLILLTASVLAQAQGPSVITCYDGPEKLIEMKVQSARFINKQQVEVVDNTGEVLTITNLNCKIK